MSDTDQVKLAVKEALDDKRMNDMSVQLTNLATQVAEGFVKITTRQDIANGKTLAHEMKFQKLDERTKLESRYEKLIWFIMTTLVGVTVYFLTKTH